MYAGWSDLGVSFILKSLLIPMSRRCLAKMSLYSTRISSMAFLSSSPSWESVHLKLAKNVALSSGLLCGSSFWMFSSSSISLRILLWMGVCVDGSPGLSGVGNQKFCVVWCFSDDFRSSLTYSRACSVLSSAKTLRAAELSG